MAEASSGAIILAGGKSVRMGQDKALLPYAGGTLLEHVAATMRRVVPRVVVVADATDKYALPVGRVLADTYPDCGPVGGIVTGLTALGPGSHIVVACDMPALQPAVFQLLLSAASEWDAAVPEIAGQPEPLHAVYRASCAPRLLKFLEEGGRSARKALACLRVKWVGEGALRRLDPELISFTNVNTPDELAAFEHRDILDRPRPDPPSGRIRKADA